MKSWDDVKKSSHPVIAGVDLSSAASAGYAGIPYEIEVVAKRLDGGTSPMACIPMITLPVQNVGVKFIVSIRRA